MISFNNFSMAKNNNSSQRSTASDHPEVIELPNGVTVVLQNLSGGVASFYWWNQVGSADEKPDQAGYAHFLEHMLFKDASAKETGKASTGKMARLIESLGGEVNAYTSFDQTVYHVTCADTHLEKVLAHFGKMATPQRFLSEDFKREREVILEELKKNLDSPGRKHFQDLFSLTFKKHPYGRPVIGFESTLKKATASKLEKFYRETYVPGKMGVILVAPFHSEKRKKNLLKTIEKCFGPKVLKAPKIQRKYERVQEPLNQSPSSWIVSRFDVQNPSVSVSFRVPGLNHEDLPALDLLSGVLGMGELSRIYKKLFYDTSLATDASAGVYVPKDGGMFYIQAEVASHEGIEGTLKEILSELKKIREVGPTSEEVKRVLTNIESERLYASQTTDGLATRLGFLQFIAGDIQYDEKYLRMLRDVSLEQIRDVARKYLDGRKLSCAVMVAKKSPDLDLKPLQSLYESELIGLTEEPPVKSTVERHPDPSNRTFPKEWRIQRYSDGVYQLTLPSKIKAIVHPRPNSNVFSVHGSVLGGLRLELQSENKEQDWGSSLLMAMTWAKGTQQLDAQGISTLVEGRAASLDGFSGRNSSGLQLTGLVKDWRQLSKLYTEVLLDAQFPENELEHSRRVVEDSIRSVEDHSSQLCTKLFLETLFEKHPYGKMTHGSLESIGKITSERLRYYHRRWVQPDRFVVSISGAVNSLMVQDFLQDLEERLLARPKVAMESIRVEGEKALRAPRWVEKSLDREQVHLLIGGLGTQITASDRNALLVLQTLLGGQSGPLFIDLREKRSLAYTVSPLSFEGLEPGYVAIYIACAKSKRQDAIDGVTRVMERVSKRGFSKSEMSRAKEYFLGRHALELQSDPRIASHSGIHTLYGISRKTQEEFAKEIRKINEKELRRVCRKYFIDTPRVTSAVG